MRAKGRRKCRICGDPKPLDEFPFRDKSKGKRRTHCRACQRDYHKRWYRGIDEAQREKLRERVRKQNRRTRQDNRERLAAYKDGKPCADCGQKHRHFVLEFDHRNPKTKEFTVSYANGKRYSWKKIMAEIRKCDLICSNCHQTRTWERKQRFSTPK